MNGLKYFLAGPLPKDPFNNIRILGLLHAAKQTALKQNPNTLCILIRLEILPTLLLVKYISTPNRANGFET